MRHLKTVGALAAALTTIGFGLASQVRANPGDIFNLGSLGASDSAAMAINSSGQVAGWAGAGDVFTAFRYDGIPGSGGIMRDLATLGGSSSEGHGVNASGQVAGFSGNTSGVDRAFRYDGTPGAGGIMRDLGTLGGQVSQGWGLNNLGRVTGSSLNADSDSHAFRYDGTPGVDGIMRDLGTLGGFDSIGFGINDSSQITGSADTTNNEAFHAFRYDGTPGAGGVMHDLGVLNDGDSSQGNAINASGQIAGGNFTPGVNYHAFRYDGTPGVDGVMHDLATLGGDNSMAQGINDAGFAVGFADSSPAIANAAALWLPNSLIINLGTWLDTVNPALGGFWDLLEADGINNNGLIVGIGTYNDGPGGLDDGTRAFLLDASSLLPEPGSPLLVTMSALALAIARRGSGCAAGRWGRFHGSSAQRPPKSI